MTTLRFGAVPYLNIEPFLAALRSVTPCDIVRRHPSRLAALWRESALDACILSVADIFDLDLEPLAGASIASDGAVRSVLLAAAAPSAPATWERIALDGCSRTSNLLALTLLRERRGNAPAAVRDGDPVAALAAGRCDAAVVIGDRALRLRRHRDRSLDLGADWTDRTGLPFVYAAWVAGRRRAVPPGDIEAMLDDARRRSAGHIAACAARDARRIGIGEDLAVEYLTASISYRFAARERAGMELFRGLSAGLAAAAAPDAAHGAALLAGATP